VFSNFVTRTKLPSRKRELMTGERTGVAASRGGNW